MFCLPEPRVQQARCPPVGIWPLPSRSRSLGPGGKVCWGKKPPLPGGLGTLCDLAWCPAPLTPWLSSVHPACLCGLSRDTLPAPSLPRPRGRSPGGAPPAPATTAAVGRASASLPPSRPPRCVPWLATRRAVPLWTTFCRRGRKTPVVFVLVSRAPPCGWPAGCAVVSSNPLEAFFHGEPPGDLAPEPAGGQPRRHVLSTPGPQPQPRVLGGSAGEPCVPPSCRLAGVRVGPCYRGPSLATNTEGAPGVSQPSVGVCTKDKGGPWARGTSGSGPNDRPRGRRPTNSMKKALDGARRQF